MTYCVGMVLDRGLVFMSDTRTNAGLDNISTFRKMTHWEVPGERVLTLMTAGDGLAITLECAALQLAPHEALSLISDFAGRMEQPLRHLL